MKRKIHPLIPYLVFTIVLAAAIWPIKLFQNYAHITSGQIGIIWAVIMLIVFGRQHGVKNTLLVIIMLIVLYGLAFAVGKLFF